MRIVDLTQKIRGGRLRINGEYVHSKGEGSYSDRRLEFREWIYKNDQHFMHWIETESHLGTHVEVASHLNLPNFKGKDISEYPIDRFLGKAILLDFRGKKERNIEIKDLKDISEGDIVIMFSDYPDNDPEAPYLLPSSANYLTKKRIKAIGFKGIFFDNVHNFLLLHDVPIIEGLINLDMIKQERFFYIGLPMRWEGLDACCIRAVALIGDKDVDGYGCTKDEGFVKWFGGSEG